MNKELAFYAKLVQEFGVYVGVLIALVILIFKILIPQVQSVFANKTVVNGGSQRLEALQTKTQTLRTTNKIEVSNRLKLLNIALPIEKDIGLMLSSIDNIAAKSNTRLGTFSVKVGSFATQSAIPTTSSIGVPSLEVRLNLIGKTADIAEFVRQTSKALPLMQVTSVSIGGVSSTVQLLYYYKPPIPISQTVDIPLPILSSQNKTLKEIEGREVPAVESQGSEVVRTSRTNPFR